VAVAGHLTIPEHPSGVVVFAHGSGSSRFSARNIYVADVLNESGIATLLFDLLTPAEERNRANVFDIPLLARRLVDVTGWLAGQPDAATLPVGYFGASTGAGAALVAAGNPGVNISAVVSRGGRPDLAGDSLRKIHAPTLLIVGGRDEVVLDLNRRAQAAIPGPCELVVVPVPPISSKNPAPSRKSLCWPGTGSSSISVQPETTSPSAGGQVCPRAPRG
jgi:putative phosphoribosyl transferase